MFNIAADFLVGAFSHFCEILQDMNISHIIVDIEMICPVMTPVEFFIQHFILPVIREKIRLPIAKLGP